MPLSTVYSICSKKTMVFSPVLIGGYGRLFDTSALLFLLSIDATGPLLKCSALLFGSSIVSCLSSLLCSHMSRHTKDLHFQKVGIMELSSLEFYSELSRFSRLLLSWPPQRISWSPGVDQRSGLSSGIRQFTANKVLKNSHRVSRPPISLTFYLVCFPICAFRHQTSLCQVDCLCIEWRAHWPLGPFFEL